MIQSKKTKKLHRLHEEQYIEFTKDNNIHIGYIHSIDKEKKICIVCSVEYGCEEVPFKHICLK